MELKKDKLYEIIGENIREARRKADVSQEELGRAIGLSRTSVTNIEKGRQPLQVHILFKIADTLRTKFIRLLPSEKPTHGEEDNELAKIKNLDTRTQDWVKIIIGGQQGG